MTIVMRNTNTRRTFLQKWMAPVAPLFVAMGIFYVADGGPQATATSATVRSVDTVVVDSVMQDSVAFDTTATTLETVEAPQPEPEARHLATGEASYYGPGFAGRPTANGERFNPSEMTAAHRTLPFGTRLRVTNERNGKSVVVRVNDRGPYAGNRILDLSEGAASKIGMLSSGTARVRIDVLA